MVVVFFPGGSESAGGGRVLWPADADGGTGCEVALCGRAGAGGVVAGAWFESHVSVLSSLLWCSLPAILTCGCQDVELAPQGLHTARSAMGLSDSRVEQVVIWI